MALVAGPLSGSLLETDADADSTVSVLLEPVEAINVVLNGLDK